MDKITILLADDHNVLRQGIAQVLQTQPDMEVVAQARTGVEAVRLANQHQPNIVLMDINMPELDGVEATRKISTENPDIRIIILTMYKIDNFVFEAIKAGANGYLLKEVEMEDLIKAVRSVNRGEAVLDSSIAHKVLAEFRSPLVEKEETQLAKRDQQILSLIAQGQSNHEIGAHLSISEKTVRNRLSQVFKLLHLKNRTEAALYALRKGLAESDTP